MTKQLPRFSVYVRIEIGGENEDDAAERVNKQLARANLLWYVENVEPSEAEAH